MKSSPECILERQFSSRLVFLPVVLMFALSLLLTACAGLSTSSQPSNTAPTGKDTLSVAPVAIDFGTVQSNSAATKIVTITNVGAAAETIQSATIAPTSIFSLQSWTGAVTLKPGQNVQLEATFSPKSAGNYPGTLTLAMLQPLAPISILVAAAAYAKGSPPPIVGVSVSPSSRTLQSGQAMQFTSTVTNTTNTTVTWDAALGSVSSSGLYTAPNVTSQTVDTVSAVSQADPTKYATASVVVQSNVGNVAWTVKSQQPVTQQFYAQSIFASPLPADAGSHLAPNSDAIVNNIFANDIANAFMSILADNPANGAGATFGGSFYYASGSDPIYKIVSVSDSPSSSANNPKGKYFHLTNQAEWDGTTSDQVLCVWDQSTDLDPTTGGRILCAYYNNHGVLRLPNNTCTTTACADAHPSTAQLSLYYASYGYPGNDSVAYNEGPNGYASNNVAPDVMTIRASEIVAGTINHAILLDDNCNLAGPVFPGTGEAFICPNTAIGYPNYPHNGALFYIDSGYNCATQAAAWQVPVCVAMQKYGGYLTDTLGTNGGQNVGLYTAHLEQGEAYLDAGLTDPLFTYLFPMVDGSGNGDNGLFCNTTRHKCNLPFFNLPGALSHIHIIDQCIPKRMAGQPGSC